MPRPLILLAFALLTAAMADGQDAKKKVEKKKAPSPVLQPIQDVPGLPRVLLIGDSISMGYTLPTRELLKGVANVHRPPTNCGPTTRGIQEIDRWLGDGKWDVIHFNFGLHDLKYIDEGGKNTSPDKGRVQVPIAEYQRNLEEMTGKMKKTGAKLIFALTTPVPAGEPQRKADTDKVYNDAAREVMSRNGVAINDLNASVRQHPEGQLAKNVHFTPDGYKALAAEVATQVRRALGK